MVSKKNKKSFLLTLALVSIFHIAVINIGSFNAQREYGGRGGVVHNIYLGNNSGGAGGETNGDSSEKKKELRKNKNLKKHLKPKSRLMSKKKAAKLKSVEEVNLDRRFAEEQRAQKLDGNAGDRGGRGAYGFGGYGRGNSLDQIRLAYLNALKIEIEKNKEYLIIVKSSDQTGIVGISFVILKDGSIIDVKIRKRSKYPNLNLLALELISKLKRFKPIPYELMMDRWKIDVDIEYKLGG